jgi:hypothetical protein
VECPWYELGRFLYETPFPRPSPGCNASLVIESLILITHLKGFTNIVPSPTTPPTSPDKPVAPMPNSNKPLPAPPAGSTESELAARPTKQLERIIAPIALPELHKIFSGAPQFFARSEGHYTGAPRPSVAFPWNDELEIRDLTDHRQFHDAAWGSISAWPHITRDVERNSNAAKEHGKKQRAHYLPRCRERPNMLSMQGLERGTMGFQAALEIGIADALQVPENTPIESVSRDKYGLRTPTQSKLVECLKSASTTYHEDPDKHHRSTSQLYSELFTQILFPPTRVTTHDDPTSLQVQVEALIDALRAPMCLDFSLVEWRIRLGSILWGPEDDIVVMANNEADDAESNLAKPKYRLLLQVLLACELLMRLDILSANIEHGKSEPHPEEVHSFDKKATSSVRWALILARYFLENIKIEDTIPIGPEQTPTSSWSLLSKITGSPAAKETVVDNAINEIQLIGRHQDRQLSGLVHFAKVRLLSFPTRAMDLKQGVESDRQHYCSLHSRDFTTSFNLAR